MKPVVLILRSLAIMLGLSAIAQSAELLEVKPVVTAATVTVEVRADIPMTYSFYKVPGQARAVVDIADVDPEKVEPLIVVNKGEVASISVDKAQIAGMVISRIIFNLVSEYDIAVAASSDRKLLSVTFGRALPPVFAGSVPSPTVDVPSPAPQKSGTAISQPPTAVSTIKKIVIGDSFIDILTTGTVQDYKVFTVKNPDRVVIDIAGTKNILASRSLTVQKFGVSAVRNGTYPGYTRIVLDQVKEGVLHHTISKTVEGLRISFK